MGNLGPGLAFLKTPFPWKGESKGSFQERERDSSPFPHFSKLILEGRLKTFPILSFCFSKTFFPHFWVHFPKLGVFYTLKQFPFLFTKTTDLVGTTSRGSLWKRLYIFQHIFGGFHHLNWLPLLRAGELSFPLFGTLGGLIISVWDQQQGFFSLKPHIWGRFTSLTFPRFGDPGTTFEVSPTVLLFTTGGDYTSIKGGGNPWPLFFGGGPQHG